MITLSLLILVLSTPALIVLTGIGCYYVAMDKNLPTSTKIMSYIGAGCCLLFKLVYPKLTTFSYGAMVAVKYFWWIFAVAALTLGTISMILCFKTKEKSLALGVPVGTVAITLAYILKLIFSAII